MFCRNCGKELCDEAFVCPQCGVLVKENITKQKEKAVVESNKDKIGLINDIFLIVSFGLACLALLFCFIATMKGGVAGWCWGSYKTTTTTTQEIKVLVNADFNLIDSLAMAGFIVSIVAVITGITVFVLELVRFFQRKCGRTKLVFSILNFMLVLTVLVMQIVAFQYRY